MIVPGLLRSWGLAWPADVESAMRYDGVSRAFHWVTAGLVLLAVGLGLVLGHARPEGEALKLRLYNLHESLGATIWVVTLARLGWRAGHPAPALPAGLPGVARFAARANHAALYLWLLVMPVVGFVATNAWGFPLVLFGLVPLPDPVGPDVALAEVLTALHRWMGWSLLGLIGLHLAGVLWHRFVRRDGVLGRMV
jgi:cytochrome b561